MKLQNGMMVTLKKEYHDDVNEVFELEQVSGDIAWAGDPTNNGWYISADMIATVLGQSDDDTEDCIFCNGNCFMKNEDHTKWIICTDCNGQGAHVDHDDDVHDYDKQMDFN